MESILYVKYTEIMVRRMIVCVIEAIQHTYTFYDYSVCNCQNITHVVELFNNSLCKDALRIATYRLEYSMSSYSDSIISYSLQEGRMVPYSNVSSCKQYPMNKECSLSCVVGLPPDS